MTAHAAPKPITGKHVLWGVILFFAVVIGLDTLFTVWAVRSFPGEVSETAYEDGLKYNRTIEARQAQAALGWTAEVEAGEQPGAVRVRLAGPNGVGLEGLRVSARLERPATAAETHALTLRQVAPGLYEGAVAAGRGAWDLAIVARDARGNRFEAERRLVWR